MPGRGARGKGEEAIGRSRGGRGTKARAVGDGLGYPLAVARASDVAQADGLLDEQAGPSILSCILFWLQR